MVNNREPSALFHPSINLIRYKLPVVVVVMNNGGIYGGDRRTQALAKAALSGAAGGGFGSDPAPTAFVEGSR